MKIYLADLSYSNAIGDAYLTIPLNIGYIAAYAKAKFGESVDIVLFKNIDDIFLHSETAAPDVIGFSCYYWNEKLSGYAASAIKAQHPDCKVIVGGPCIDTDPDSQKEFFEYFANCTADYIISGEGEVAFSNIIEAISLGLPRTTPIDGVVTFVGGERVAGQPLPPSNPSNFPSPFLTGVLDSFLNGRYMPMIQTSRHCPYTCTFCVSGKTTGKIRTFPPARIADEIRYIAERYRNNPDRILYIVDENFGIQEQDVNSARAIDQIGRACGFPRMVLYYVDKKFTDRTRQIATTLHEYNSSGYSIPFQTMNVDALNAVKRRNLKEDEVNEICEWAKARNICVTSELIFGFPFETADSFIDSIEFCLSRGIMTSIYNLILFRGAELNRRRNREKYAIKTKFRMPYFPSYYMTSTGNVICDSEEVVVSSADFSRDDFMLIRRLGFCVQTFIRMEFLQPFFAYLRDAGLGVIRIFLDFMDPTQASDPRHRSFIAEYDAAAEGELFDDHASLEAAVAAQALGGAALRPTRVNAVFAARLIYEEEEWLISWLSRMVRGTAGNLDPGRVAVAEDLLRVGRMMWIDPAAPVEESQTELLGEALAILAAAAAGVAPEASVAVALEVAPGQRDIIDGFLRRFGSDAPHFYYQAVTFITPWHNLRYRLRATA